MEEQISETIGYASNHFSSHPLWINKKQSKGHVHKGQCYSAKIHKGTHNADSIIESKIIYYLEQCELRV